MKTRILATLAVAFSVFITGFIVMANVNEAPTAQPACCAEVADENIAQPRIATCGCGSWGCCGTRICPQCRR